MTAKVKKILVYLGVSAAGIFSVLLLITFITAQMKLVESLSPQSAGANPSGSESKASPDSPAFGNPSFPGATPDRQDSLPSSFIPPANQASVGGPNPGGAEQNPVRSPQNQSPQASGADWPAGMGTPPDSTSGQISGPSAGSGSGQNQGNSPAFTQPPPAWNKPFIPYKGYREGEQPPWSRPTKYVVEMRKNDPNFNLLDELDRTRKKLTEEAEQQQNQ